MENANVEKLNKEPMSTKQKVVFGLKIAGNVVFYVIIILLFLFSLMNINAGGKGGIPNLFGKGYLSVQSESMSRVGDVPDYYSDYSIGAFEKGDLVSVTILGKKDINSLKKGDVITFYDKSINSFNTHRIVYLTKDSEGNVETIMCQGDYSVSTHNLVFDPTDTEHSEEMNELSKDVQTFNTSNFTDIKGKVTGVKHGWGNVMDNIQRNWLWYFVLPVLALLLFEIFMVVKNFMDLKAEKQKATMASDKEAMLAEIAAEKERMRQELLEELKSQQDSNNESKEEDSTIQEEESKEE